MDNFNIDINSLNGQLKNIALGVDKKNQQDNQLSGSEISLFMAECETQNIDVKKESWYQGVQKYLNKIPIFKTYVAENDATRVDIPDVLKDIAENKVNEQLQKYKAENAKLEKTRQERRFQNLEKNVKLESEARGVKLSDEDIQYWSQKIFSIAEQYDVSSELIVSIIGKETKFAKNVGTSNGAGPMQVTTTSVNDFFPGAKGSRNNVYQKLNNDLLEDILYAEGANGEKKLNYKSPTELRKACKDDHDLGIKTGFLVFQMKYAEAIHRETGLSINEVIDGLKDKSLELNENTIKKCMTSALKNYNSVFKTYGQAVVDSLETHGYDFSKQNIIK